MCCLSTPHEVLPVRMRFAPDHNRAEVIGLPSGQGLADARPLARVGWHGRRHDRPADPLPATLAESTLDLVVVGDEHEGAVAPQKCLL